MLYSDKLKIKTGISFGIISVPRFFYAVLNETSLTLIYCLVLCENYVIFKNKLRDSFYANFNQLQKSKNMEVPVLVPRRLSSIDHPTITEILKRFRTTCKIHIHICSMALKAILAVILI